MEQFNLEEWLKDKSRKIVTRDGKPVRIVCWDKLGDYPIIGCIKYSDNYEDFETYNIDGSKYSFNRKDQNDLFFADEKNTNKILDELKSYLENTPKEQVEKDWKEIQDWYAHHFTNEKHNEEKEFTEFEKALSDIIGFWQQGNYVSKDIKTDAKTLIDLARKEIEKDIEEGAVEFAKSYMEDVNPSFEKVQESEELWKWKMSCLKGVNKAYTNGKQDALKDLPRWKKCVGSTGPFIDDFRGEDYLYLKDYVIKVSELFEKLLKEE